jgi:SAM-dependent methyltransferase
MKPHFPQSSSRSILLGSLLFAGGLPAVEVLENGGFESASPAGWPDTFGRYNHNSDVYYSGSALSNTDDPGAGTYYSWNNLGTQVVSNLASAAGSSTTSLDTGGVEFTLSAWLSGYSPNPEFSGIELTFFDATGSGGTQVGAATSFDGDDPGGLYNSGWSGNGARPTADEDRNTWTFYKFTGNVPAGARRAEVRIFNSAGLSGSPDTYVDLVRLDITDNTAPGQPGGLTSNLDQEAGEVTLNWNPPTTPFTADQLVILRDGIQIATPPGASSTYLDTPPISANQAQSFKYILRYYDAGNLVSELTTTIQSIPDNIAAGLVAYYRFEGDYRDTSSSASSHHGTSHGGVNVIGGGVHGHALCLRDQAAPTQAIVLGDHADFDFGSSTDFTVSLWFQRLGTMENNSSLGGAPTDAAILTGKDWASGSNVGWGIFTTSDGGVKWNYSDGSTRKDHTINVGFGNEGVADGQWHHLVVTHDRDGLARFYIDGISKGSTSISGLGSIDTGLPLTIGSDGNLNYPWGGCLDEVAIWRRVLVAVEIAEVYETKVNGQSLSGLSIIDSDGDGMDDTWEIAVFGNLNEAAEGDPDNDGQNNFQEYALGTSPALSSASGFSLSEVEVGGKNYPLISYQRPAVNGAIAYHIERSTDLSTWDNADDLTVPHSTPTDLGSGLQRHHLRFTQPVSDNAQYFYRVRMYSKYQAALSNSLDPTVEFRNGSAYIRWQTKEPTVTILDYGLNGEASGRTEDYTLRTEHEVVIANLDPGETLAYTVIQSQNGDETRSRTLTTSRAWDYSAPSYPDQAGYVAPGGWSTQAANILALPEVSDRGYCLDLRCGNGHLSYELARQSSYVIIAVEDTQAEVDAARQFLTDRGVYGSRVTVILAPDLNDLPFESNTFNLVISQSQIENSTPYAALVTEATPLAKPGRGVVAGINGAVAAATVKTSATGTDTWTSQYSNPGNSGANQDELGGKSSINEFELNWIGRPGPEIVIDRMVRAPSPLNANGRFYCQGLGRVLALDSHNGCVLWSKEVRDLRRLNMIRDASNMNAADEGLYLAVRDKCWLLAGDDGKRTTFDVIDGPNAELDYQWGYVCRTGDQLLGSATSGKAFFKKYWGQTFWFDAQSGAETYQVCSDNLFSLDPNTGMTQWQYERGLILNVSITVGDGKIFFLETTDPGVIAGDSRRLSASDWKQSLHLVCLDQATGNVLWDKTPDLVGGEPCIWLQYAEGRLLLTGSRATNDRYYLYGFDPANGNLDWSRSHGWKASHHGGNHQHPVMTEGYAYLEPHKYLLTTGDRTSNVMPGRSGCSTFIAAKNNLFFRGNPNSGQYAGNIAMWNADDGNNTAVSRVRPGCWLSYAPAGGMILVQEQGAGCSCGSWMESSFGLAPKN